MNRNKIFNWVLKIMGVISIVFGIIQIITQGYVHPTSYGIMVLIIGVLAVIISFDKREIFNGETKAK